jgi:hypothetical protein
MQHAYGDHTDVLEDSIYRSVGFKDAETMTTVT